MGDVPGGKNGSPEPNRDMVQGKPGVISGEPPTANWRRYARVTIWVVVVVLTAIFLMRNSEPTEINFVFFSATAALWIVLLAMLLIGFLLGWSASWWSRRRKRARSND